MGCIVRGHGLVLIAAWKTEGASLVGGLSLSSKADFYM